MPLREQIEHEIRDRGPIPFSRYMQICLYDPQHGYYSRNAEQFGKAGDFYTSSDIHAVFGRLMARQFEEIWRAFDRPQKIEILELGPGRGLFACDVLDWSKKKFPDFFTALTYTLEESSPALKNKLKETLTNHLSNSKAKIKTRVKAGIDFDARVNARAGSDTDGNPRVRAVIDADSDTKDKVGADTDARADTRAETRVPKERPTLAQRGSAGTTAAQNEVPEGRPNVPPNIPDAAIPRIVFANEFFDALPVEILSGRGKLHLGLQQSAWRAG